MNRHIPTWITVVVTTGAVVMPACSSPEDPVSSGSGGGTSTSVGAGNAGNASPCPARPGAGGGPTSPLQVVAAKVVSGTEVRLTFSEAVKPPTDVDPKAFRLSAGEELQPGKPSYTLYNNSTGSYSGGPYMPGPPYSLCPISDGDFGDTCVRHPDGPACVETVYRDVGPFSKLEQDDATHLIATLARPIGSSGPQFLPCGGLFLHYSEGGAPVEDLAGHRLEPIAPDWVDGGQGLVTVGGHAPAHPIPVDRAILDVYCAKHHCSDGLLDGDETDVDCGDVFSCPGCALGKHCDISEGCASRACIDGVCVTPTCTDHVKDGDEGDVDCGGSTCPGCGNGKGCSQDSDCTSQNCSHGVCRP